MISVSNISTDEPSKEKSPKKNNYLSSYYLLLTRRRINFAVLLHSIHTHTHIILCSITALIRLKVITEHLAILRASPKDSPHATNR